MLNKLNLGDWVNFTIKGEIEGVEVTSDVVGCIVEMRVASSSTTCYVEYGISRDPTGVYHYGKAAQFWKTVEELTLLQNNRNEYTAYA